MQDLGLLEQALSRTIGAMTASHGADCLDYALIGQRLLERLGCAAQLTIGSAAWRVGPGSGDVISHALEIAQQANPGYVPDLGQPIAAGMFHAWLSVGPYILDFTTASLVDKARLLDEADGGRTTVQFRPDFLLARQDQCVSFAAVVNGYRAGVFNYVRHEALHRSIEPRLADVDPSQAVEVAWTAFRTLAAGEVPEVIGLGEDGEQTLQSARLSAKLRRV